MIAAAAAADVVLAVVLDKSTAGVVAVGVDIAAEIVVVVAAAVDSPYAPSNLHRI